MPDLSLPKKHYIKYRQSSVILESVKLPHIVKYFTSCGTIACIYVTSFSSSSYFSNSDFKTYLLNYKNFYPEKSSTWIILTISEWRCFITTFDTINCKCFHHTINCRCFHHPLLFFSFENMGSTIFAFIGFLAKEALERSVFLEWQLCHFLYFWVTVSSFLMYR